MDDHSGVEEINDISSLTVGCMFIIINALQVHGLMNNTQMLNLFRIRVFPSKCFKMDSKKFSNRIKKFCLHLSASSAVQKLKEQVW